MCFLLKHSIEECMVYLDKVLLTYKMWHQKAEGEDAEEGS